MRAIGISEKIIVSKNTFRPNTGASILTRACEKLPEVIAQVKKCSVVKENKDYDLLFANYARLKGFDIGELKKYDFSSLAYSHSDRGEDAYRIALSKYFRTGVVWDAKQRECMKTATGWMRKHFRPFVEGSRVMPLKEVMDYLPKDKSPGFVWKQYFKNKSEVFNDHEAVKILDRAWEAAVNQGAGASWWTALLKDELRLKEKVVMHKTRLFTAGSTEHAVIGDRLCLDFNLKFYSSCLKSFSAVGMSPYKRGFDILRRKLRSRGFEHLEALDISNFDGSVFAELLWEVCRFRFEMFAIEDRTQDNWNRLVNWYYDSINSIMVLQDGSLVMKDHGQPSGTINTVVDNTLINFIYFAFCWLWNGGPDSYDTFMEEVIAVLYGDDNTYTYSDFAKAFVSGEKVAQAMKSLGIEVTGVGERTWDNVDFLSHSFERRNDCFLPALDFERLFCGMLLGGSMSIDESWQRASAFRAKAWPNPRSFDFFDSYMKYLLTLEPNLPMNFYASEDEIMELYLGCRCESNARNKMNEQFIDNLACHEYWFKQIGPEKA